MGKLVMTLLGLRNNVLSAVNEHVDFFWMDWCREGERLWLKRDGENTARQEYR